MQTFPIVTWKDLFVTITFRGAMNWKKINVMETRVTNCGANVYFVFLPKTNERTDFVKFGSPKYSDVSDLSKGYLLIIDKSNFTRWHAFTATTWWLSNVSWLCMVRGRALVSFHRQKCVFKKDSTLEKTSWLIVYRKYGDNILYSQKCAGDTVYFPYGLPLCFYSKYT